MYDREDDFKEDVIKLVKEGKYVRAFQMLDARIKSLLVEEELKKQ